MNYGRKRRSFALNGLNRRDIRAMFVDASEQFTLTESRFCWSIILKGQCWESLWSRFSVRRRS